MAQSAEVFELPTPKQDDQSKQRKAYGEAMSHLRETFREEFDRFLDQAYLDNGIVRKARLRSEEVAARKAQEAIDKAAKQEVKREAKRQELLAALAALDAPAPVQTEPTF